MKKQGLLILCFFSLFVFSIDFSANAQQARITGKVTDAGTGEGIPGASVLVTVSYTHLTLPTKRIV